MNGACFIKLYFDDGKHHLFYSKCIFYAKWCSTVRDTDIDRIKYLLNISFVNQNCDTVRDPVSELKTRNTDAA